MMKPAIAHVLLLVACGGDPVAPVIDPPTTTLDDLSLHQWHMTWTCAVPIGPGSDSLKGDQTTTSVVYTAPVSTDGKSRAIRFTFAGQRKIWNGGQSTATLVPSAEVFDGKQYADSIVLTGFGDGSNHTRRSASVYETVGSRCGASGWIIRGVTRIERQP